MDRVRLVPKFSRADLEKMISQPAKEAIENAILLRLQRVGEQFVTLARTNNTYKDRTGNLRNSIGYIILKDGEQLFDNFQKSARITVDTHPGKNKESSGGDEGIPAGLEIAKEVAAGHPQGFVLIGVAGMDYAAAVEAKGFDVLTGSSSVAAGLLQDSFGQLQKKLSENKF